MTVSLESLVGLVVRRVHVLLIPAPLSIAIDTTMQDDKCPSARQLSATVPGDMFLFPTGVIVAFQVYDAEARTWTRHCAISTRGRMDALASSTNCSYSRRGVGSAPSLLSASSLYCEFHHGMPNHTLSPPPKHGFVSVMWPPEPTWTAANVPDLSGKVMLVTGGNAGIGRAVSKVSRAGRWTLFAV